MKLEDFPMILTPKIEMKNPNENICLHPGTYTIKWKDKVFKSDGSLIFKWLPRLTVKFRGKLGSDFDYSWVEPFETDLIVEITSENPKINIKGGIYKIRELPEHIEKIIKTYKTRPEKIDRYARSVSMNEIASNDFNLNISRYVSTAKAEEKIDLKVVNKKLVEIEIKANSAAKKHNKFLEELGLPPV